MGENKSDIRSPKTERQLNRRDASRSRQSKFTKEKGKAFKKKTASGDHEREEITYLNRQIKTFDFTKWEYFKDAPLSVKTKAGLDRCGFKKPTRIQKESLALALQGKDVLGAAKTGSGKTLAFIVPILETLFREMWTRLDGLGALVITPTRELAYQIFEVLKKVGARHDFSAGLIIGGTEVGFEKKRLQGCNIIICTPGRLLQHMDQNPLMDPTNLKILVLDEADRILDMGFQRDVNAILENLPTERQTLLFSATQTKSVKDLARLSLREPTYISVHEKSAKATPEDLDQNYLVCELQDKLSLLWSFLKSHKSKKIIVFMSCCKQVHFMNTVLRRLRPGTTVLHLHGNMSQPRRMAIYEAFCSKQSAILLATDLAARGLDFPKVDWVMQLDCPEDADTYIHRVGRTARFGVPGNALLVLLPTEEESMIEKLEKTKVPINKIEVNPNRFYDIQRKLEAMCARDVELKASAQRSFVGYLKYVFMQKDKQVFRVEKLDLDLFSRSLGLVVTPRVRFLEKYFASKGKKMSHSKAATTLQEPTATAARSEQQKKSEPPFSQLSRKIEKFSFDDGVESDEEIFTKGKMLLDNATHERADTENIIELAATSEALPESSLTANEKVVTKIQAAKKILRKKHIVANKKVVFTEDGDVLDDERAVLAKPLPGVEERGGINIELSKRLMKEQDRIDKQIYREKIKAKHREERLKAKAERRAATLGGQAVLDIGSEAFGPDEARQSDNNTYDTHDNDAEDDADVQQSDSASDAERTSDANKFVGIQSAGLKRRLRDQDDAFDGADDDNDNDDDDDDNDDDDDDNDDDDDDNDDDDNDENEHDAFDNEDERHNEATDVDNDNEKCSSQTHVLKKPMKIVGKFGLKRRKVGDVEELDTGLNLAGDEELALKLLQS